MTNRKYGLSCGGLIRLSVLTAFLMPIFCLTSVASAATYTASLSTSGTVTINATSQGNGAVVGTDTLTVNSTCPSGYNITIEGPSDTNLYLNGNSANNTSGTYIAHSTGTTSSPATITGNNLGTWGYSTTSSTGSGTFIGLTNTATTLTTKNSASASGGDTIPVYYGVSIPSTLTPGTYQMPGTSAITYYLTRSDNCVSYLVSFNANGGSGTTMPSQRIYEDVATPLSANTYTAPTGKIFKEWNTSADGTGTSYTDEESVTNITSVGTTLQLYAIWITPIYMQDMSFDQCTTTPMTVYDKRDMQEYTVAKLADGNCWLLDNLALDLTDSSVRSNMYNSSDTMTNASYSTLGYLFNGGGTTSDQYATAGVSNWTSSYSYSAPLMNISDKDEVPQGDDPMASDALAGNWKAGGYYNYCAASAGSYCYGNGTSAGTSSGDAAEDICPAGWRMPTGDLSGEYYIIYSNSNYNTYENFRSALHLPLPGIFYNGLPNYQDSVGSVGRWWSSTRYNDGYMNYLFANTSTIDPTRSFYRNYGYSVRCIKEDPALYRKVEKQSKGTQTASGLQTTISSSNSGVYKYNSTAFGTDTDGTKSDNTKATIYYYRGILDNTTGTYGSDGDAAKYPNYVILQAGSSKATTDTCWRIIRTTGSGGVKMIYNGLWTGSTCANATTSAQISSPVSTSTFNGTASTASIARQVVRVGYTHNSTYASSSTTTSTAFATVMGSDTNYSVNNTDSTIKGNVETWYNNTISDFEDMLEPNAGFCNDRYSFTTSTGTTATSSIRPYTTSTNTGATYVAYFAGYQRNATSARTPSLGCYSGRNTVDIYSTDISKGGNGQLSAPVGLLTADEASFAGSGSSTATNGSTYNAKSYLNTGSNFWTMTPSYRSSGYAYNLYISTGGVLTNNGRIDTAYGVRPVISLVEGTPATSGTGIATDPWVVTIPEEEPEEPDPVPDPISCASNKICYAPNSYDNSVVGTMGQQSANASTETILLASNFSREGYGFAGWNTEPDYSGTFYGPQETITTPSDMSSGLPLYAIWVKSKGYFQDSSKTRSVCRRLVAAPTDGTANLSSVSALTDQRDNETYAIAKLADGNCWMIENLRLESTNSDNSTGALAQGYGTSTTYGNFSGLADAENTFNATAVSSTDPTDANSLYYAGTQSGTATINISQTSYAGFRMPRYNNYNHQSNSANRPQNPTTNSASNSTTKASLYSYGNYYTWAAAIADTAYYTSNQSATNTSICPSGWRLPKGGDKTRIISNNDNEFWNLTVTGLNNGTVPANYGSETYPYYTGSEEAGPVVNTLKAYPNNFLYSGVFLGPTTGAHHTGARSFFWTSTSRAYNTSYDLYLNSTDVYPGTEYSNKFTGFTIRCLVNF